MYAAASTGCRAVLLLRGRLSVTASTSFPNHRRQIFSFINGDFRKKITAAPSYSVRAGLDPPDLLRLAETARISLTPNEVEEFAPKIEQVLDWFGQLQAVDLESIEPSIRAETEGDSLRDDLPHTFENRESIIAAIPSYEEPYIKVPKVLNKE